MATDVDFISEMDLSDVSTGERIGPVTPGEVLREEFMEPRGLSGRALARELGVASNRVTDGRAVDLGRDRDSAWQSVRHVSRVLAESPDDARSRGSPASHGIGGLETRDNCCVHAGIYGVGTKEWPGQPND
jgi:hypothetical protein